jgi:hypothetical protein
VPDVGSARASGGPPKDLVAQLADIFAAFGATISYDKASQKPDLGATVALELLPQSDGDRSGERSRVLDIAGERSGLMGDLSTPIERAVPGWPGS